MKIAYIIDAWFPYIGGGQIHLKYLAEEVSKYYEITVFTRNFGTFKKHLDIKTYGKKKNFGNIWERFKFIFSPIKELLSYNIYHSQCLLGLITANIARLFNWKAKIIHTVHGSEFSNGKRNPTAILEFLILKVFYKHQLISVSQDVKKHFSEAVVIPNGIIISNKKYSRKNKTPKLLYIGRIEQVKGILDFCNEYVKTKIPYTLTIIGEGSQKDRLPKDKRLIIKGRVPYNKIENEYLKHDCLILPSYSEGNPLTVMEAMSYGLPIISMNVGNVSEIGNNRIIVVANHNSMIEAIKKINPCYIDYFAQTNLITWKEMAKQTMRYYK